MKTYLWSMKTYFHSSENRICLAFFWKTFPGCAAVKLGTFSSKKVQNIFLGITDWVNHKKIADTLLSIPAFRSDWIPPCLLLHLRQRKTSFKLPWPLLKWPRMEARTMRLICRGVWHPRRTRTVPGLNIHVQYVCTYVHFINELINLVIFRSNC
jgi:hypothetical protein